MQAQLYEQRQSLDDEYRSKSQDSQIEALEAEAQYYEDSTRRYIETLKRTLKEASRETADFIANVSAMIMTNADIVLDKYQETGLEIDEVLTKPWDDAAAKIEEFGGSAGIGIMDEWTSKGGFFDTFMTNATTQLQSPWYAGMQAMSEFSSSVDATMQQMLSDVQSNVQQAIGAIQNLYSQIQTTPIRIPVSGNGDGSGLGGISQKAMHLDNYTSWVNGHAFSKESKVVGGITYRKDKDGYWLEEKYVTARSTYGQQVPRYKYYAKGTTGTKKDEWAITDEPQYGPELTLVPTDAGNLSFMRTGTGVVPADLTKSLMEIGAVGLDGLMNPNTIASGINIISNAINKPEYNFSFGNLLHIDNCTQDTIPQVKAMIRTELDNFTRKLNYSLKTV